MAAIHGHMELANLESYEYLPDIDSNHHNISTLSSPLDCPSLSESFLSDSPTALEGDTSRRASLGSSTASDSPGWRSGKSSKATSPATPATSRLGAPFTGMHRLKCEQIFDHGSMYDLTHFGLADKDIWTNQDHPQPAMSHMTNVSTMQLIGALRLSDHSNMQHLCNPYPQGMSMNPPLSRPIFGVDEVMPASMISKDETFSWSKHFASPLKTIAPSAAFPPVLTSSPLIKHEPATPCRGDAFSTAMLSSSPMAFVSPPVLPSQHDMDDELPYEVADNNILPSNYSIHSPSIAHEYWSTAMTPDRRHGRPTMHRRGYERKRTVGHSYKPRPVSGKSGINCDAIIAQNEFACSYPGCIDKSTGKQKRFKRQEHKKRHENTVHEKKGSFKCWVKTCGRTFTRSDNLQSHKKNTHGKKSANQRNDYVATLDPNSEYYDPEWKGDVTKSGIPVFHGRL